MHKDKGASTSAPDLDGGVPDPGVVGGPVCGSGI